MESTALDHRRFDALLAAAEKAFAHGKWAPFRECVVELRDALLAHFAYEEEVVFPQFERTSGMREPTAQLCTQHRRIREILDALASVSPGHDPKGCRAELATLALLYRQHKEVEEVLMYPAFARALPAMPVRAAWPQGGPALDLRGLEPPQPVVRILDALERAPGNPLRVLLPHEPQPLYGLLREQGFEWSGAQRADGGFELTIRKA
jgi:uncharacterized protein (DUF2249 family)